MCCSNRRNQSNISANKSGTVRLLSHTKCKSDSSDEDSYAFVVSPPKENNIPSTTQGVKTIPIIVEKAHVRMIVDTGAAINILDSKALTEIKVKNPTLHLQPTKQKIYAYMQSQPLPVLGKFEGLVESKHRMAVATFYVMNGMVVCY